MKNKLKTFKVFTKFFFILLFCFLFLQDSYSYEQTKICKQLVSEIQKKDLFLMNKERIWNFGVWTLNKWNDTKGIYEDVYDKKPGYATIDKLRKPKIVEGPSLEIEDKVVSINDIPISEYKKIDFEKQNYEKIYHNYNANAQKNIYQKKYKIYRKTNGKGEFFDVIVEGHNLYGTTVTPQFIFRNVNYLNNKKELYEMNFKFSYTWFEPRLLEVFRQILINYYIENDKHLSEYNQEVEEKIGYEKCMFNKQEFIDLGIYDPDLKLLNMVRGGSDEINEFYEIRIMPEEWHRLEKKEKNKKGSVRIRKFQEGTSTFYSKFLFRSFPFDAQDITIKIANDHEGTQEFGLLIDTDAYSAKELNRFTRENNLKEWKLTETNSKYFLNQLMGLGAAEGVEYILRIERNYHYYLFKILLPIILILTISWAVFWITPREIESRLTVSIVCLLALIAYNFVIDDDLPKLEYLTVMDWVILVSYVFATVPTIITIISFVFYDKKDYKMSNIIDQKSKIYFPIAYVSVFVSIAASIISTQKLNTIALLGFLH